MDDVEHIAGVEGDLGVELFGFPESLLGPPALGDLLLDLPGALLHPFLQPILDGLQRRVPLLDLAQHLVEAVDQDANLVIGLLDDADRVVAVLGHGAGAFRQLEDGARDVALEPKGKQEGHQRGEEQHDQGDEGVLRDPGGEVLGGGAQEQGPQLLAVRDDGPGEFEVVADEPVFADPERGAGAGAARVGMVVGEELPVLVDQPRSLDVPLRLEQAEIRHAHVRDDVRQVRQLRQSGLMEAHHLIGHEPTPGQQQRDAAGQHDDERLPPLQGARAPGTGGRPVRPGGGAGDERVSHTGLSLPAPPGAGSHRA